MDTSLYEHFGNIEDKNGGLYHHNIGLKPTPGYKIGFMLKTGTNTAQMFDKVGNAMDTMKTTGTTILTIIPVPSRGKIVMISTSSGWAYVDIFDGKTGVKSSTISIQYVVPTVGVFENGDVYILDRQTGILYIYDIKGNLLNTVAAFGVDRDDQYLFANSKLGLLGYLTDTKFDIYRKSEVSTKTPKINDVVVGASSNFYAFTSRGNIIETTSSVTQATVDINYVDYETNTISSVRSVQMAMQPLTNRTPSYNYLNSFDGKIYFEGVNDYLRDLIEINELTGEITYHHVNSTPKIMHVDNEIMIASNNTTYQIYSSKDFSLLYTISSDYGSKMAVSTKGKYENFYKYW